MVGLETMKGVLGATTLFVRRVLLSGSLHGDCGCRQPGRQWTQCPRWGVHELLKTNGMTTAPRFQLQRTSRGWVRIRKYPLIQIGELGRAHRNVVWSTRLLSGFCWPAFSHFFFLRCAGLVDVLHNRPIIFEEFEREVLWTGSKPCRERTGSFTSADGKDYVAWELPAISFLLTCWPGPNEWDSSDP